MGLTGGIDSTRPDCKGSSSTVPAGSGACGYPSSEQENRQCIPGTIPIPPSRAVGTPGIPASTHHSKIATAGKARHDERLVLHTQKAEMKADHEKTHIERHVKVTDKQMDVLVYTLCG